MFNKEQAGSFVNVIKNYINSRIEKANLEISSLRQEIKSFKRPVDGRDALDLEILPSIEESKAYPRGTYAKHNGGLWRSFQTTDGLKGWECIVEGINKIDIVQNDERDFTISLQTSSGEEINHKAHFDVVLDKGIFDAAKVYVKGDGVSYTGSFWIAQKETSSKPGTDDNWRLSVKRGQNGKEVVKIPRDPNAPVRKL